MPHNKSVLPSKVTKIKLNGKSLKHTKKAWRMLRFVTSPYKLQKLHSSYKTTKPPPNRHLDIRSLKSHQISLSKPS